MIQLSAQQRYAALQVMGTQLWVPRVRLVGAAASQPCDWPEPAVKISARERVLATLMPAATVVTETSTETQVPVSEPVVVPVPLPQPVEHQPAEPLLQVQPLHVDVWLMANGWQLVMENLQGQPGLQPEEIKLLQNLMMALYPGALGISAQQFFSWPLPGIPVDAGDEGEMSMALRAFLTGARFQKVQLAGLLVFGSRLNHLLNNEPSRQAALPQIYTAPALSELLQQPQLKHNFWQQAGDNGLRAAFARSPVVI
ncbi:MAG: hypothetical protein IBX50_08470 [Marinospirillum sp.]|uniref:hypothetical protein n=1 Tax=Marinospirillum sp. TaxID=2183934 RepID=UPI0019F4CB5F|nr:hypothetical protein [Marinospirillum sp.]MBE0506741.1 hypothetical protein [Marinospirillum sp.]